MESQEGAVTLYEADCIEILEQLRGQRVVFITDPPYGISLSNHGKAGGRRKEEYAIEGDGDRETSLKVLGWAMEWGVPTIAFASPWAPWPGVWRDMIAYDKGGAVGGGGDTRLCLKRTWELIQVARTRVMNGSREGSVWRFPMVPRDTVLHIAAKPEELMTKLVLKYTTEDDVVIDPFMGSGTTGVACIQAGRRFIGIEKVPAIYQIAQRRIEETLMQPLMAMMGGGNGR